MFAKLLIACAVAAVAMGIEYPTGLHPSVCPNFPYCDMEVLARHTPEGMPIPEWELPYARMVGGPIYAPFAARFVAPLPAKAVVAKVADVDPVILL